MKINIAICDDDKHDLDLLTKSTKDYGDLNQIPITIHAFSTAEALRQANKSYDCYIIDVVLDHNASGIDITKEIRLAQPDAKIIIISSNIVFAKDAVNIHANYYILKPLEIEELHHSFDILLIEYIEAALTIFDTRHIKRRLPLSKIAYIETMNRNSLVTCVDQTQLIVRQTISKWESDLNSDVFVKCYRGLIVNIKQIKIIDGNELHMRDGNTFFVSRVCLANVKKRFYKFLDEIAV